MSYIFYQAYQTERANRFKLSRLTSHKFRRLEMLKVLKQVTELRSDNPAAVRELALKLPEDLYAKQWLCSLGTNISNVSLFGSRYFFKSYMLLLPLKDDIDVLYGIFGRLGDTKQHLKDNTKILEAYTSTEPTCFVEQPKGDDYESIWEQESTN